MLPLVAFIDFHEKKAKAEAVCIIIVYVIGGSGDCVSSSTIKGAQSIELRGKMIHYIEKDEGNYPIILY